ncbi:ThiF family adenylyltransferase [Candidatus Woesearchaeota archaeon]|nr:ThiF family adenylyltransferase [Candidatus Woesearchaeota archaeon]
MKIVVVGCGTTGNLIIPKLKGDITIIDRDIVEEKNLNRLIQFTKKDIEKPKAEILGKKCKLKYKIIDLDYSNVKILKSDLVIDCTDNMETRFLINEYCIKKNIPWIYIGVIGNQGRTLLFNQDFCFRCIFSEVKGLETCETAGVDMNIVEKTCNVALEEISKMKSRGLWANGEWIKVRKNKNCPVCNGKFEILKGKREKIVKYCGSSRYQFNGNYDFELLKKRFKKKGDWFVVDDFYVFRERILVKAKDEKEAKLKLSKFIGV